MVAWESEPSSILVLAGGPAFTREEQVSCLFLQGRAEVGDGDGAL